MAVGADLFAPSDVSPDGVFGLVASVPHWVDDDYTPVLGCAGLVSYQDLCAAGLPFIEDVHFR